MLDTPTPPISTALQTLMKQHGISENELSKRSGVPQASIHRMVNGKIKSPKYANVEKITRALGVTPDFLMKSPHENSKSTHGAGSLPIGPHIVGASCTFTPATTPMAQFTTTFFQKKPPVHLYPEVSWREVRHQEKLQDAAFVSKKSHYYSEHQAIGQGFWMTMQGDSMSAPVGLTPTLPEGTKILFDTGQRTRPGRIVLALLSEHSSPTCRLLVDEGGQLLLKPLNPVYPLTSLSDATAIIATALEAKYQL